MNDPRSCDARHHAPAMVERDIETFQLTHRPRCPKRIARPRCIQHDHVYPLCLAALGKASSVTYCAYLAHVAILSEFGQAREAIVVATLPNCSVYIYICITDYIVLCSDMPVFCAPVFCVPDRRHYQELNMSACPKKHAVAMPADFWQADVVHECLLRYTARHAASCTACPMSNS